MTNETYNQCENCYDHLTIAIGGNLSKSVEGELALYANYREL